MIDIGTWDNQPISTLNHHHYDSSECTQLAAYYNIVQLDPHLLYFFLTVTYYFGAMTVKIMFHNNSFHWQTV
jgi:hypothetical protein